MKVEVHVGRRAIGSTLWRAAVGLAIAFHFSMIALQLTPLRTWPRSREFLAPVFRVADYYRALSYANRNFRFFAPGVGPDRALHIEVQDGAGVRRPYRLPSHGREFELRVAAMLDHFAEDSAMAESFAAAWAARAFAQNPEAVQVVIEVRQNRLPSMDEYRRGARLWEEPIYRKGFAR
jgi:hypothetical protein